MQYDTTWLDELADAFDSMTPTQQANEQAIAEACPWCRVGLAHSREEHYSTKPQGAPEKCLYH